MRYILGFLLLASASYAAPGPANRSWFGQTPASAEAVTTQLIISQSTVVTVTIPPYANQFIYTGDGGDICDNLKRCGFVYPTSTVSSTGWIRAYNGLQRTMPGNESVSTSLIYVRSGAVSNTTHDFEWSRYP